MPDHDYGEFDAQKAIALYSCELNAMAEAAIAQYPDLEPPGALLFEPGATEADQLRSQMGPHLPIRVVEDGTVLLVLSMGNLRETVAKLAPQALHFLSDDEFAGADRLPIFAVCKRGFLMGSAQRSAL